MNSKFMPPFDGQNRWRLRWPTTAEWLLLIAIAAILIALIIPSVEWAADGSMRFPVRVLVFDATSGMPIANAGVTVFRAPPLADWNPLEKNRDRYNPRNLDRMPASASGTTGADGAVVMDTGFETGASHKRPTSHAKVSWIWVYVHAEGYGAVVVPARHDSQPVAQLKEQKELLVPIGLVPLP